MGIRRRGHWYYQVYVQSRGCWIVNWKTQKQIPGAQLKIRKRTQKNDQRRTTLASLRKRKIENPILWILENYSWFPIKISWKILEKIHFYVQIVWWG